MDEARTLAHAARVRALNDQIPGITLLAGIECDVLPDGRMDLADDCLRQLDVVIASVHSALQQSESEMTARLLRAIEHPGSTSSATRRAGACSDENRRRSTCRA
jgi:DNA polymerase (family 10)